VDQAIHTGNDLGKGAEGHQLHDANVGNVAHLIGLHELIPGVAGVILHAQRDLALLGIEGDDIHIQRIADGNDLGGVLDAAPAQLGDMDHAVHTADVHEHAVGGHGLDNAIVVLTHFDVVPDLSLGGLTGLVLHSTDGTHHAAAGTVDLGNPQGDGLADHLAQLGAAGLAGLGSGNEHAHALNVDDDAALVFLGDLAFQRGLVLAGLCDVVPHLHGVQTLLGQHGIAFHIVDADDVSRRPSPRPRA